MIEKVIWRKGREGQSVETYFRMNLLAIVPHLAGDNKPGSSLVIASVMLFMAWENGKATLGQVKSQPKS